jgi:cytochrome P450
VLDIDDEMMKLTLNIVAKTLFNSDMSNHAAEEIGGAVAFAQNFVNDQFHSALPLPMWLPLPQNLRMKQARHVLDRVIQTMIEEHKASGEDSGDLLSMLIRATDEDSGGHMSDDQLRDEAISILAAGHETTSNALTWTWYLLSEYPQVGAKLVQELDTVLAERLPTVADLANLPYTEMVIKESMRVYPPVWAFNREPVEDTSVGGCLVKKGEMIVVCIDTMHHLPQYFEQPDRFIPERWTEAFEKSLPRQLYVPFAAGPHICIGQSFSMMEARLILATVAQRWSLALAPSHEVEPEPLITLGPKNGMWVTPTPRQPALSSPQRQGEHAHG